MRKLLVRAATVGVAAAAIMGATAGMAGAATRADAPASGGQPSVWVGPALDLGSVLGSTDKVPELALKPIDGLLTALHG
jgi:hypothetical protein